MATDADDQKNLSPDPIKRCADAVEESYDRGDLPNETAIAVLHRFHSWLLEEDTLNGRRIAARYIRTQILKHRGQRETDDRGS